jgi:trans-aconitate methyltransferase
MKPFEFDGEKYKQASKHQKEWGNKLMSGIDIKGNESILDLGCGDGVLSQQLSLLVPNGKVIGIDASMGMIQTAKEYESENLTFICADINSLAYENAFDIIFSNAALHWVKKHKLLLQNSYAALKSNGRLAWNFAGDGTCAAFINTVKSVMNMPKYQDYFADFEWPWYMPTKDDYTKLFESSAFKQFEILFENADRTFQNCDEMVRWVDQPSIVPFLECVPDSAKASFRNTVVQIMIDATKQPDGTCFETFRRINVKALK